MEKNEIINKMITELYYSNWLIKQCLYVTKEFNNAYFLQSDVTYLILTYKDNTFIELYKRDELKKYLVKVILNCWRNKNLNKVKDNKLVYFPDFWNFDENDKDINNENY